MLKMRGVQMIATDSREYITVLLERGETADAHGHRASARWGLSQREAQILSFIGGGKTGPGIALILGIGHDTTLASTPARFSTSWALRPAPPPLRSLSARR